MKVPQAAIIQLLRARPGAVRAEIAALDLEHTQQESRGWRKGISHKLRLYPYVRVRLTSFH